MNQGPLTRMMRVGRSLLPLALLAWHVSGMAEALVLGKYPELHFALGWKAEGEPKENVLQFGVVYACGEKKLCADVETFPGRLNLQRQRLTYRHEMRERTHAVGCTDEFLTMVHGQRTEGVLASLEVSADRLVLHTWGGEYTWKLDDRPSGRGYVLAEFRRSGAVQPFDQAVGHLFGSDGLEGFGFARSTFDAYFEGDLAHKNTLTSPDQPWALSRTSIDFRKFTDSKISPVMSMTVPGAPEALKRMRRPVEVQMSILAPQSGGGRLRYFSHEYGHDFNGNGCFDEFGHDKLMLPVVHEGQVDAFLFLEYTPDNQDKIPMLSVGEYERKKR